MNVFKKLSFFVLVVTIVTTSSAMKEARDKWEKEKPKVPEKINEKEELVKKRNELDQRIKDETEKKSATEEEIDLDTNKLKYYDATINKFNFNELATNQHLDEKTRTDARTEATIEEEKRKKLDGQIIKALAERNQDRFNPSGPGNGGTIQPNKKGLLTKIIETIQSTISKIISKLPFAKSGVKGELDIVSIKDNLSKSELKANDPERQRKYQTEAILDELSTLDFARTYRTAPPDMQRAMRQEIINYIKSYTSALLVSDIEYAVKHEGNSASIEEYHKKIINNLKAINVSNEQIAELNQAKDNAVKQIEEKYRKKDVVGTLEKFFTNTSSDNFRRDNYEKKLQETVANFNTTKDLKTFKTNIEELETTLDSLSDYAKFSPDLLSPDSKLQLNKFLQEQYTKLEELATNYTHAELREKLTIEETKERNNAREKSEQALKRLEDDAIQAETTRKRQAEVQEIKKKNEGARPSTKLEKSLATQTIPKNIAEFKELLLSNAPTTIELYVKKVIDHLNSFATELVKSDPSRISADNAQKTLDSINGLQDVIDAHAKTGILTQPELKKLAEYYFKLENAYAKIIEQRNNNIADLFRRLSDGTMIFLEKAIRDSGKDDFNLKHPLGEVESIDTIIARFEAERAAMAEESEGGGFG